jgi:hypothetical protein
MGDRVPRLPSYDIKTDSRVAEQNRWPGSFIGARKQIFEVNHEKRFPEGANMRASEGDNTPLEAHAVRS